MGTPLLMGAGSFGSATDPFTTLWLAQLGTPPSSTVKNAVNAFFIQCRTDGNLLLLDRFWLFAQDVQANAKISLVNPTSTQITEVNAPTWTSLQGYTGNGTTSYLNSNFSSSTGPNFSTTSACLGVYCRTNSAGTTEESMGATTTGIGSFLYARYTDNKAYAYVQTGGVNVSGTVSSSNGLVVGVRTSNIDQAVWKDGISLAANVSTFGGTDTTNMYILGRNNSGSLLAPTVRQHSAAFTGGGTIDQLKLYNAFNTMRTSIGF